MTYRSDWNIPYGKSADADISALLAHADEKAGRADDEVGVISAIQAYEEVLAAAPLHFEALASLGHLYLLLGDGYGRTIDEKKEYFLKALRYNERALYTNNEFKLLVDQGVPSWEAAAGLTEREMTPMLFWVTAIFYYYKECLNPVEQAVNYHWIRRTRPFMDRMRALDSDFGGGAVHFTDALYYLSIPEFVGGDRKKAKDFLQQAIAAGPKRLLNRWGAAKYFHIKMGDREKFAQDLEWVLAQDITKAEDHYAWKAFFKKDAERLLENIDTYFSKGSCLGSENRNRDECKM
jgi:tetratricopeptide (TPR) repeat protein